MKSPLATRRIRLVPRCKVTQCAYEDCDMAIKTKFQRFVEIQEHSIYGWVFLCGEHSSEEI